MAARVPQPTGDEVGRGFGRLFSKFAFENNVYCVPVDAVRVRAALSIMASQVAGKFEFVMRSAADTVRIGTARLLG